MQFKFDLLLQLTWESMILTFILNNFFYFFTIRKELSLTNKRVDTK